MWLQQQDAVVGVTLTPDMIPSDFDIISNLTCPEEECGLGLGLGLGLGFGLGARHTSPLTLTPNPVSSCAA